MKHACVPTDHVTDRTVLRRKPGRGTHDRDAIVAIVDEALVCHVGFCPPGETTPCVLPTAHVRIDEHIYLHGAQSNRMLGQLAQGVACCVAITLVDGLVLSRVALHHSVNYRSVVAFGHGTAVDDPELKRRVLAALLDKLCSGRSDACRPPDDAELAATLVVAIPICEASAKIRQGPPLADNGPDATLPYWAGVIPLVTSRATPERAPDCLAALPPELG